MEAKRRPHEIISRKSAETAKETPPHDIVGGLYAVIARIDAHRPVSNEFSVETLEHQEQIRAAVYEYINQLKWRDAESCVRDLSALFELFIKEGTSKREWRSGSLGALDFDKGIEGHIDVGPDFVLLSVFDKIRNDKDIADLISQSSADAWFADIADALVKRNHEKREQELEATNKAGIKTSVIEIEYDERVSEIDELDAARGEGVDDETYLLNQLVETIGPFGNKDTIDRIVELVEKYDNYVSMPASTAYNKINPSYAAQQTLPYLKHENPWVRSACARILYRLEFGRIGISEDGVRYLNKIYDLGEHNNPEYFAQRLTNTGDVGIFDRQKKLIKYFQLTGLDADHALIKARVLDFVCETLFISRKVETLAERQERERYLKEFQERYFHFYNNDFFKDTDVRFNNLSFREQGQFLIYYQQSTQEERKRLLEFVRTYREHGLKSFITLEYGLELGEHILALGESTDAKSAQTVFDAFANLYEHARIESTAVAAELKRDYPDLEFDEQEIFNGLIERGKDLIVDASRNRLSQTQLQSLIVQFHQETNIQHVLRSQFLNVARLLEKNNINLTTYEKEERAALEAVEKKSGERPLFLRALHALGRLKPIPEIHWRVDRTIQEQERRLGIDLVSFLRAEGSRNKKKILLELGAGSGEAKRERASKGLSAYYHDFALSDNVYYSLQNVFEHALDFQKLEDDTGAVFLPTERGRIAEFLYKSAMIKNGQSASDAFEYDESFIADITDDINCINQHLANIQEKLQQSDVVPSTLSSRDDHGRVLYTQKILLKEQSEAVRRAVAHLRQNLAGYIPKNHDWYNDIEAYAPGTVISRFSEIDRMEQKQIDIALAVRSTVYEQETDWMQYLESAARILKKGGILIDDSVRDNDGWYYRLGELLELKEKLRDAVDIHVVLGPGFPNEDYRQDLVPLALVLTRNGSGPKRIEPHLKSGYEVRSLDNLLADTAYLHTLDATGRTAARVKAIPKRIEFLEAA